MRGIGLCAFLILGCFSCAPTTPKLCMTEEAELVPESREIDLNRDRVKIDGGRTDTAVWEIAVYNCDSDWSSFCRPDSTVRRFFGEPFYPWDNVHQYAVPYSQNGWDIVGSHDTILISSKISVIDTAQDREYRGYSFAFNALRTLARGPWPGIGSENVLLVEDVKFKRIERDHDVFVFRLYRVRATYVDLGEWRVRRWNIGREYRACGPWILAPVRVIALVDLLDVQPIEGGHFSVGR